MLLCIGLLIALAVFLVLPASPTSRLHGVASVDDEQVSLRRVGETLRQRALGRSAQRAGGDAVLAALVALAAELRAGLPPQLALVHASTTVWPTAIAAVRLDGDVAMALRADGVRAPVLRSLAACWEAGAAAGSGLADAVDRLASSHRAAQEIRGELEVQLAGPRATARMLSGLPLIGIILGLMLGADPVGFLLGGPIGWACLAGGILLTVIGMWWTNRIAARVEAQL